MNDHVIILKANECPCYKSLQLSIQDSAANPESDIQHLESIGHLGFEIVVFVFECSVFGLVSYVQTLLTLNMQGPSYLGLTRSIS